MEPVVIIPIIIAVFAALAAIVIIPAALRSGAQARVVKELDHFRLRYTYLREHQIEIGDKELLRSDPRGRTYEIPMLAQDGWIAPNPVDLATISISLSSTQSSTPMGDARLVRGLSLAGPITYKEAISKLHPSSEYFNGTIYRPMTVTVQHGRLSLGFEVGKYFDYIDTSEILAYEASMNQPRNIIKRRANLDPFDLTDRVASLGILTLTIVRASEGPKFFLHKRSGKYVVGDALYHVVPAGEFAPSDIGAAAVREDFDLWRNIMREYAEEYLGLPDAQGHGGRRIEYATASPYRELNDARVAGNLQILVFGIALDPLTFKPELLTVAVFRENDFDSIFPRPFTETEEGKIVEDIPFTDANVQDYLRHSTTRHGAKACLSLAWQHRIDLGL